MGFIGLLAACSGAPEPTAAERVDAIASEFVHGYYSQFPEEAYESGFPDAPMDRFGDHSETRLAAWNADVDAWLAELDALDPALVSGTPAAVTYLFARERMQALVGKRVCRMALWNISPTWTGWQTMITSTLAVQPVGTESERDAVLARAATNRRFSIRPFVRTTANFLRSIAKSWNRVLRPP